MQCFFVARPRESARVSRRPCSPAYHSTFDMVALWNRADQGATYVRQGDHQVGHWPTF